MQKFFLTSGLFFFLLSSSLFSQTSAVGIWKTIDDNTSEAKSHLEIYDQGGKLFGKIIKILTDDSDALCEECSGDKKDQPVLGMVIMEGLKPYEDYWKSGTILDPENGNEYGCSIWFEDGTNDQLKVRGKHWTGFYRTQTWYRVK